MNALSELVKKSDIILVLNAGSSSIKFTLFMAEASASQPALNLICDGQMAGIGHAIHFHAVDGKHQTLVDQHLADGIDHDQALDLLLQWITQHFSENTIVVAGHRVVHGGDLYTAPVVIDDAVITQLRRLIPLAPLHQPHHIAAMVALRKLYPNLVQIACFDTAFHHTNSKLVTNYAIPRELTSEGVRRYGFHGLSYEYIASVLPTVLDEKIAHGKVIVAHLGAGASMCAIEQGKSVASTMGFTALDGLPMSRRCGNIDPGVVLYLMQAKNMTAEQISHLLCNDCGMLGVSGVSDDMKTLLGSGDPHAKEAIDLFVYRIARELGSLVAALGGLDALIFTAGIGEHAAPIRQKVAALSAWLGIEIDAETNLAADGNEPACLSSQEATVATWVIPTNEDLMIAQHTLRLFLSL